MQHHEHQMDRGHSKKKKKKDCLWINEEFLPTKSFVCTNDLIKYCIFDLLMWFLILPPNLVEAFSLLFIQQQCTIITDSRLWALLLKCYMIVNINRIIMIIFLWFSQCMHVTMTIANVVLGLFWVIGQCIISSETLSSVFRGHVSYVKGNSTVE